MKLNRIEIFVSTHTFAKNYKSIIDAFNDSRRVTKSHIPIENVLIKINVPEGQIISANKSKKHLEISWF